MHQAANTVTAMAGHSSNSIQFSIRLCSNRQFMTPLPAR
ncbi:hypothetical protein PSN_5652 [Pseudomonas sp. NGC7]